MRKTMNSFLIAVLFMSSISLAGCSFGSKAIPTIAFGACWLDSADGGNRDSAGDFLVSSSTPDLVLRGWAANDITGESPKKVTAIIADAQGKVLFSESGSSSSRPDVAQAYKKPEMENSGFEILIENMKISGKYTVSILGEYKTGPILCPRTFTLVVS